MDILLWLLGGAFLLLMAGWLYEITAEQRDRRRIPPPGKLYPVNAHRLHLDCRGARQPGQPAVILEAGLGNSSYDWRRVAPKLAEQARVCAYDRAGYGWSDPAQGVRTIPGMAAELHTLLELAGEPGPYVLVGHSYGGNLAREFYRQHPETVVGMVLVDSAHEDQMQHLPEEEARALTASLGSLKNLVWLARLGLVRLLARSILLKRFPSLGTPEEQATYLPMIVRPVYYASVLAETRTLVETSTGHPAPPELGALPLVVIEAGGHPETLPPGYTEERWLETRAMFNAIQEELAGLSTSSRLVVAEKSVHAIQLEQPEVVIEAVREVLGKAI